MRINASDKFVRAIIQNSDRAIINKKLFPIQNNKKIQIELPASTRADVNVSRHEAGLTAWAERISTTTIPLLASLIRTSYSRIERLTGNPNGALFCTSPESLYYCGIASPRALHTSPIHCYSVLARFLHHSTLQSLAWQRQVIQRPLHGSHWYNI